MNSKEKFLILLPKNYFKACIKEEKNQPIKNTKFFK